MTHAAADTLKNPQVQAVVNASSEPVMLTAPTSTYRVLSAGATTNADEIKGSPARLHKLHVNGAAGHVIYIKLYNITGTPDEGDIPTFTIAVTDGPVTHDFGGHVFTVGLGIRAVLLSADNDTSALTAADFLGLNIQYT